MENKTIVMEHLDGIQSINKNTDRTSIPSKVSFCIESKFYFI